jgi:hypothetical protein
MKNAILALAFAACSRSSSEPAPAPRPAPPVTRLEVPTDEHDCVAAGGKWHADGYAMPSCMLPTRDGGRRCTDWNECEAGCFASMDVKAGTVTVGTCASCYHCTGGCWNEVRGGRAKGGECN